MTLAGMSTMLKVFTLANISKNINNKHCFFYCWMFVNFFCLLLGLSSPSQFIFIYNCIQLLVSLSLCNMIKKLILFMIPSPCIKYLNFPSACAFVKPSLTQLVPIWFMMDPRAQGRVHLSRLHARLNTISLISAWHSSC